VSSLLIHTSHHVRLLSAACYQQSTQHKPSKRSPSHRPHPVCLALPCVPERPSTPRSLLRHTLSPTSFSKHSYAPVYQQICRRQFQQRIHKHPATIHIRRQNGLRRTRYVPKQPITPGVRSASRACVSCLPSQRSTSNLLSQVPTACAQSYTHTKTYAYAHTCPPTDHFPAQQSPGDLRQTPPDEKPLPYPSTSPQTTPSATAPPLQASSVPRPGASIPHRTGCRAIPSSTSPNSHPLSQLAKRSMA
jgi:hypothetical protein